MNDSSMKTVDSRGGCSLCGKHGTPSGMCQQHHWMHIIIKILVALFIFWCGVQFGELKGALHGGYRSYDYGMMGGYGERNQVYFAPANGMMGAWFQGASDATTTGQ